MATVLSVHPASPTRLPLPVRAANAPFTACMLVPTGIGASVGGFGGDASLALNLLATACDRVVTHPNVANAAVLQNLPKNVLYVEGYALNALFKGEWALRPMAHQRIGVVLDAGLPDNIRTLTQNAIAAMQTVYGVDIVATVATEAPVRMALQPMPSGTMVGTIDNPEVLINAAQRLVSQHGATAIALGVLFPHMDMPEEAAYRAGAGADPIGALEALLSHTVVRALQVPCANAPMLNWDDCQPETDKLLDPRLCAEFIAPTFLPCVLTGLRQAPAIIANLNEWQASDLTVEGIHAVVVPANAMGSVPVLTALAKGIPIITVMENQTVLDVTAQKLLNDTTQQHATVITANTYAEAAGYLLAMQAGLPLALPSSPKT